MSRDPRSDGDGFANEQDIPRDPVVAGFSRGRRPMTGWTPDPNGNRGQRRAAAKAAKRARRKKG